MTRILFGGSFDPIHIGHLHLADLVSRAYPQAKILFVPSHQAAHKRQGACASSRQRIKMLSLALHSTPWEIEDLEIRRGGTSYTIDTVRELREREGWTEKPGFLIGDDLLPGFSAWKEAQVLAEEVQLIVANRINPSAGFGQDGPAGETEPFSYPHVCLNNSLLPVSSSEIRRGFAENAAVRYLLHPRVFRYIRRKGLYGCERR